MLGFTLAEVLITLVIIGVIAAITVPSLINKTNKQETVSKLKKAYSTLSQATNQIITEEGPLENWFTSVDNVFDLYKKKLINAKECNKTNGCYEQQVRTCLNSTPDEINWNTDGWRKLVLADGTQLMLSGYFDKKCSLDNNNDDGSKNYCSRLFVDINGAKGPNTYGRDVFAFVIKKKGIEPAGCDYDNLCNKTKIGHACACKVIRENAMNY